MLIIVIYSYDTQDGLYDVAWSEVNENQLVVSSGDGSIKMWDTTLAVRKGTLTKKRRVAIN